MKWKQIVFSVLVACLVVSCSQSSQATSISNSLTGFSGDTTQAGTQGDLATAGFSVFSTDANPAVTFDTAGATFGSAVGGDDGRNYLRTTFDNYASADFVAEITFERTNTADPDSQNVFFGMGAGDTALFGVPDWSTQFSSVFATTDPGVLTYFITTNDTHNDFESPPGSVTTDVGVHRFQLTYDSSGRTMVFALDTEYAGGAFSADVATTPIDLNQIMGVDFFGPDGWPNEPSRIFFGGDDGAIFRDLSITVIPEPATLGLVFAGLLVSGFRSRKSSR